MVIHIESRIKAIEAARVSLDKKAKDTLILELKDLTFIADYFVICSGENVSQVKAIVEHIGEILKRDYGIKPMRIEGLGYAHWVLMDYGDVVIHIFEDETRAYYELEKFWLDAPRIPLYDEDKNASVRRN